MLMKKNILIYLAALAGIVLAGCEKTSVAPDAVSDEIRVQAAIGSLTKVSYDGVKSAFEAADTISVYAWIDNAAEVPTKRVVDGVVNTLGTDGKWYPRVQMLWKTVVDPHYFIGVAPARKVSDFTNDTYEQLPLDYAASDLLIATNVSGVKASDGVVALSFDHAMAKLQVNLNFRSQWNDKWDPTPAKDDVIVTVKAKTVGSVDYLAKEITALSSASVVDLPLPSMTAAASGYTYSYSNLIIPQGRVTEITVKVGDNSYLYTYPEEDGLSLVKGKVTTVSLKVGREQIDMDGISVDDWVEGYATDKDGEAMESDLLGGISGSVFIRDLKVGDILVEGAEIKSDGMSYDYIVFMDQRYTKSDLSSLGWTFYIPSFPFKIGKNGYFSDGFEIYKPVTENLDYGDAWEVVETKEYGSEYCVYIGGVKKEILKLAALDITSPELGQVIGDDGKNYAYESLPSGVSPVARILAINGDNGIALALTDEGEMDWDTAITACAAHTPAFRGGEWALPTMNDWNEIFTIFSPSVLRSCFSGIGGTDIASACYWSASKADPTIAYVFNFTEDMWVFEDTPTLVNVRACLKFKVKQSSGSIPT